MRCLLSIRSAGLAIALCLAGVALVAGASEVPVNVRCAVSAALGEKSDALPELLTSATIPSDVELVVREVAPDHSTGGTRLRLQCVPTSRCLNFYVLVRGIRLPSPTVTAPAPILPRTPPDVRAGDHGALVNSSSTMRITLPVTVLDTGRVGEMVRVRFENHLIWRVRVIAPGLFAAVTEVH